MTLLKAGVVGLKDLMDYDEYDLLQIGVVNKSHRLALVSLCDGYDSGLTTRLVAAAPTWIHANPAEVTTEDVRITLNHRQYFRYQVNALQEYSSVEDVKRLYSTLYPGSDARGRWLHHTLQKRLQPLSFQQLQSTGKIRQPSISTAQLRVFLLNHGADIQSMKQNLSQLTRSLSHEAKERELEWDNGNIRTAFRIALLGAERLVELAESTSADRDLESRMGRFRNCYRRKTVRRTLSFRHTERA
jgi:hypothetical protein